VYNISGYLKPDRLLVYIFILLKKVAEKTAIFSTLTFWYAMLYFFSKRQINEHKSKIYIPHWRHSKPFKKSRILKLGKLVLDGDTHLSSDRPNGWIKLVGRSNSRI